MLREQAGRPRAATDRSREVNRELEGFAATVNQRLENADLTSITGFSHFRGGYRQDLTDALLFSRAFGAPFAAFVDPTTDRSRFVQDENLFTQEVRLNSKPGAPTSWVVGLNYLFSDFANDFTNRSLVFPPSFNGSQRVDLRTHAASVFADTTVPVTDELKASFGMRIGGNYQSYMSRWVGFGPGSVPFFRQSDDYADAFGVGRFALSYALTPEERVYGSVANGFSSGGFTQSPRNASAGLPDDPVRPTRSISYEVGVKTARLGLYEFNAALFWNDVRDGQLFALEPATFRFLPESQNYRTAGGEVEGRWSPSERFDVFGAVGLTYTKLVDVPGGISTTGARVGNRVPNVPRYNVALGAEYRHPLGALVDGATGSLFGRVEYRRVGGREADIANSFELRAYDILNLRAGWRDGATEVYAFANNALDTLPELYGSDFGTARSVVLGRSRVVGAGATYRW